MGKRIAVAGGGHGGIACAALLAEAGYDVTVYEQRSRKEMGHDWTDIFDRRVLTLAGIPEPPKDKTHPIFQMSFAPPCGEPVLRHESETDPTSSDIKMERRDLYDLLISHAESAGVTFVFDCAVEAPLLAGDRVIGLKTANGDVRSDMVIDACGAFSPVRAQLPGCCGIDAQPKDYEIFYAYRAFYNVGHGEIPRDKHKVYLLPNGNLGIAWVAYEKAYTDLLIGEFFPFTLEEAQRKAAYFREHNPILGDTVLRGGELVTIPVRQTLAVMVADGYAAIGDSAFMTIPIIGSGIANSLRAAVMLADVIKQDKEGIFSAETLWDYQRRYYRERGSELAPFALIKLMLTKLQPQQLDYLFQRKVLTIKEMSLTDEADRPLINLNTNLLQKGSALMRDGRLTAQLAAVGADMAKLTAICRMLPKHYSRFAVQRWADKYNRLFTV